MQLETKLTGTVRFDSDPSGALVYVDGHVLVNPTTEEPLRTPTSALLYEGTRDFIFVLQGYEDTRGTVIVIPNTTVSVHKSMNQGKSQGGWGR